MSLLQASPLSPQELSGLAQSIEAMGFDPKKLLSQMSPENLRTIEYCIYALLIVFGIWFWEFLNTLSHEKLFFSMTFFPTSNSKPPPATQPSPQRRRQDGDSTFHCRSNNNNGTGSGQGGAILFDARPPASDCFLVVKEKKAGPFKRWIENSKRSLSSPWSLPTISAVIVRAAVNTFFVFWFTYRNIHPLGLAPTAPIDCNLLMTGSLFSAGVAMSFSTLIFVHRAAILWKSNLFVSRIFLPSLWLAQTGALVWESWGVQSYWLGELEGLGRVNRCFFLTLDRESQGIAHASLTFISLVSLLFTYFKLAESSSISFSALFPRMVTSPKFSLWSKTKPIILFWIPQRVAPSSIDETQGFSPWENGVDSSRIRHADVDRKVEKALFERRRARQRLALSQTLFTQGLVYFIVNLLLNTASLIFLFIGQNVYLELILMLCAFIGCSITATRACHQLRVVSQEHIRAWEKAEKRFSSARNNTGTGGGSGSEGEVSDGSTSNAFTTSVAWSRMPVRSTFKVETLDQIASRVSDNNTKVSKVIDHSHGRYRSESEGKSKGRKLSSAQSHLPRQPPAAFQSPPVFETKRTGYFQSDSLATPNRSRSTPISPSFSTSPISQGSIYSNKYEKVSRVLHGTRDLASRYPVANTSSPATDEGYDKFSSNDDSWKENRRLQSQGRGQLNPHSMTVSIDEDDGCGEGKLEILDRSSSYRAAGEDLTQDQDYEKRESGAWSSSDTESELHAMNSPTPKSRSERTRILTATYSPRSRSRASVISPTWKSSRRSSSILPQDLSNSESASVIEMEPVKRYSQITPPASPEIELDDSKVSEEAKRKQKGKGRDLDNDHFFETSAPDTPPSPSQHFRS